MPMHNRLVMFSNGGGVNGGLLQMKRLFLICFSMTLFILCLNNISSGQENNLTVKILEPADGSFFNEVEVVEFSGVGITSDGIEIRDNSLEWISDIDGTLGTGDKIYRSLRSGVHIISLTIKDSAGNTFFDQISITVGN